ncbi:MAG: hypothetical protein DYH13_05220 [Alphaproteobacteria bacterium PRO2]|nr:hypothetical protein [Alphaproteobacteria bacterium PRO2]
MPSSKTPTELPEILRDVPDQIKTMLCDEFHESSTASQRMEKLQRTRDILETFQATSVGDPLLGEKMEALYTYARANGHSHVSFAIRGLMKIELPESAYNMSLDKP